MFGLFMYPFLSMCNVGILLLLAKQALKRSLSPSTLPRTLRISGLRSEVLKPTFLVKNDGKKWSRIFDFEILLAPSELPQSYIS